MKINDLQKNLEKNINIKNIFKLKKIFAWFLKPKNTNDLKIGLSTPNISRNKFVKVIKNNQSNFDSFTKDILLRDLNLKKFSFSFHKRLSFDLVSKIKNFRFTKRFFKWLSTLFLVFIFLLYIDKLVVESLINSWYNRLIKLKENPTDISYMASELNNVKFNFLLWDFLFTPFKLIKSRDIENGWHIIRWWKELTLLWDNLLHLYSEIISYIKDKWIENIKLSNIFYNLRLEFYKTQKILENSIDYFSKVSNLWNDEIESKIFKIKNKLTDLKEDLNYLNNNFDSFLSLLWHFSWKEYLVVFQNTDEIRPTGGFMWTMWILSLFEWKIKSFDLKDVYSFEWDLKKSELDYIKSPKWIDILSPNLWLRDSNYFINLKDNSEMIRHFIESAWYEIDGIIYINQNTILDLLDALWSVQSVDLDKQITSENFSRVFSTLVEAKIYKSWTLISPKQVLFDFIIDFKNAIYDKKEYLKYSNIILENLKNREILFYSFDEEENDFLKYFSLWLNIDYSSSLDFAYPVFTSVSWNKSDRYIKREFYKNIKINDDCSIDTNLDISLTHFFSSSEEQKINQILDDYQVDNKDEIMYIQWRWRNLSFVRVLLPKEAIVEPKLGLTVNDSSKDKKIVDFYMETSNLQTKNFNINYKLENKDCKRYDFIFYKQPGIKSYNIEVTWGDKDTKWLNQKWDFYINF